MTSRKLVGLIGANIGGSLSPALHEDAFAAAGMVGHYHLMDIASLPGRGLKDLLAAVRTAGFSGVNVTYPFKEAVIPLLDEVSPEAMEIGAVNTVVIDEKTRTTGHNTDRSGFRCAFLEALDGSCRTPIAALAKIADGRLAFLGEVLTPDGKHCWRRSGTAGLDDDPIAAARALGLRLGAEIKAEAGPLYQTHFGDKGW